MTVRRNKPMPAPAPATATERLQKVLATAGFGSRRGIEEWITAGRVTVNGQPAQLGQRLNATDRVAIDGRPIHTHRLAAPERRVIAYHKPQGEMCTRADPEGRPTIFAQLPKVSGSRWVAVGRLDFNTSGLILLTTDGELAHRLMHPSCEVEREYAVRVRGEVPPELIKRLLAGVELDDGPAAFDSIMDAGGTGSNHWYHVTLREGRNREVRRLWETQGITVSRLIRVRYGQVPLGRGLREGHWRELEEGELTALLQTAGMAPAVVVKPPRAPAPRATAEDRAPRAKATRGAPVDRDFKTKEPTGRVSRSKASRGAPAERADFSAKAPRGAPAERASRTKTPRATPVGRSSNAQASRGASEGRVSSAKTARPTAAGRATNTQASRAAPAARTRATPTTQTTRTRGTLTTTKRPRRPT